MPSTTRDNLEVAEISIPVPFGFIRGKKWTNHSDSDTDYERMIAIHGWQDNCGTFDTLLPLVVAGRNIIIVAIDLPGHGFSSHFPDGCPYSDLNYVMDIKRVLKFLNWDKVSLLGHSMGGYVSIFFSSLFPSIVEKVISLDIVKPLTFNSEDLSKSTANAVQSFLDIESKLSSLDTSQPTYTYEDAIKRLIQAHSKLGILSRDAAEILLKRGCQDVEEDPPKDGEKFAGEEESLVGDKSQEKSPGSKLITFTRDPRLRAIFFTRLDTLTVKAYVSKITSKMLIIRARDGIKLDEDSVTEEFIQLYQKSCPCFNYAVVDGQHHVHLCQPEIVAPIIGNFLDSKNETTLTNGNSNGNCIKQSINGSTNGDQNGTSTRKVLNVDDVIYAKNA